MKNARNWAFWRRGLALLLAVCLAAGYVPVPGYAEGCTHEHGEECYEVTTECVHIHGESCWSDPALAEAGEEPDACTHECTEETGCVVRVLNCGHVHDEACGEGARVQEEEPREEPQEEPEPQPEEPKEEEPKEEPKEEPQPQEEPQPEEVGEVAVFEGCAHEHVNMETGVCEDCQGQAYEAKIGKKGYTTLVEAVAAAAQSNDGPTVTMLCDADLVGPDYVLPSGKYVVDLNGHMTLILYTENVDADITIKSSAPGGKVDAADFVSGTYTIGSGARWKEINVGAATLRIQEGKFGYLRYQYSETTFLESDISISGGEFDVIGPRGSERPVSAFLAPGYAFYDMTSKKVVNAAEKTGLNNVYVDVHTHDFTTGTCACGLLCDHKTADLTTGKCGCGKVQLYQAKIGTTGYATLDAALTEAQKTENCTVTLLCNVSGEYIITGGTFTLDLNGRTISSSMKTIRLRGGALTLTDSGTGGGATGNVAVDMSAGELNIQGGTYSGGAYGLYVKPDSATAVSISGGAFEKIGLAASMDDDLVDCLALNRAFYADPDGKTLVNAAVKELSGTVYVREHTRHTFDADGACPCGYQCPHTEAVADMTTGKCACGKVQIYEAKIGDTGYGSLGGAMDAAEEKPGCTVTLLCDVSNEESAKVDTLLVRDGGYTLDLNGHKIERTTGGCPTVVVESNLVIVDTAGGGQITNTCGDSAINVREGSLTIQGGTIGGDMTAEKAAMLTIAGGAFMGKLRHIRHFLADDLADGYAFYADPDGDTIVSGAAEELTGPLYVRNGHSHRYVNGECDCGQCSHTSVNMSTGKCAQCGYQVYLAKVGENKGYATLREALAAAAQTPNSTVTLLADVNVLEEGNKGNNYCYVLDQGTFTLNLNGRKVINEKSDKHFGLEIFRIQGANLTIEGDAPGSEIRRDLDWFVIALNSGSLTIRGGKITGINAGIYTSGGKLTISGGTLGGRLSISEETTAAISGGSFREIGTDHDSLLDVLAPGHAFFDTDSGKIVDAAGQELENVCVQEHTHTKRANSTTCVCGHTFPYAAVTQAPEPLTLTYTGQPQALVTPGTVQGGKVVYSLTENGTYSETIPTGTLPKAYTVYYKVQGDDSHLDTESCQEVHVLLTSNDRYLEIDGLKGQTAITIDGKDYPIEETDGIRFVTLPEAGTLFTTYTYGGDPAHPYPTGMNVYVIERNPAGSTAAEIPDFRNLLTYAGCSIRISGKQGIRMITSLDEVTKKILTGKGLNGYTLEEYGTVVSWTENLAGDNFLRLGETYARSNYAYLKGKADPVFARKNGVTQYTNVLLLENLTEADYDKPLTLRAYIKLKDADGNTVTLYGGTVTRSIYYVAAQNADTYKPGTTGYKFVHKIIDAVEGWS